MTAFILAIGLLIVMQFVEAYVAKSYWDWFLASTLGFLNQPLIRWFSLNMIVSIFCRHLAQTKDTRNDIERLKDFGLFCLAPGILLVIGYLIHRLS